MYNRISENFNAFVLFSKLTCSNYLAGVASPYLVADEVTALAEQGEAEAVETRTCFDLTQFFFQNSVWDTIGAILTLKRDVHVINDRKFIIKCLNRQYRNSLTTYPSVVNGFFDHNNMLFCPPQDHLRLRKPLEALFSRAFLDTPSAKSSFAFHTLFSNKYHYPHEALDLNTALTESTLTEQEQHSTLRLLGAASSMTTPITERFLMRLIQEHPIYSAQISAEWENYFCFPLWAASSQDTCNVFIDGGEWQGKKIPPSHLLRALVYETLRLFPPIPDLMRVATKRFTVDQGTTSLDVHSGDVLVLNVMGYQRNPLHWKSGSRFDPHNFLKADGSFDAEAAGRLLVFGAGEQTCLGRWAAIQHLLLRTLSHIAYDVKNSQSNPQISLADTVTYKRLGPFIEPETLPIS